MSQEKVDRYKAEKKNRKKGSNKDKRANVIISLGIAVVIIALCAFIIWSVYATYFKSETTEPTTFKLTSGEISRVIDSHEDTTESETDTEASTEAATTAVEDTTAAQ